jgi:hypothetical protein
VPFSLAGVLRDNFFERLSLKLWELKVIKHDCNELLEGNIGLKSVDPGLVSTFSTLPLALLVSLLNDITGLLLTISLSDPRRVFAVNEAVLLHRADWNLDDLVPITPDDRLLREDIPYVVADRILDLLSVSQPISGAPVGALRAGNIRTKYGRHYTSPMWG